MWVNVGPVFGDNGRRSDFQLYNQRNLILQCSLWVPMVRSEEKICVVYLHSMNGSRLECKVRVLCSTFLCF